MMIKDRILFLAIGQGAGNVGESLLNKGLNVYFVNPANEDLDAVTVDNTLKCYIPNVEGCNKDRIKGKAVAHKQGQYVISQFKDKFPQQDIVIVVFTAGGGSGSGMGVELLKFLANNDISRYYCAMSILPSLDDTMISLRNAIECKQELDSIEGLCSRFTITNNALDSLQATNEVISNLMLRLVNINDTTSKSSIDKGDLETILVNPNEIVMGYVGGRYPKGYGLLDEDSVFARTGRGCDYIAYSIKDDADKDMLVKTFGEPLDWFKNYNDSDNFYVVAGLPSHKSTLEEMSQTVTEKNLSRAREQSDERVDVPNISNRRRDRRVRQPSKKTLSFDEFTKNI